MSATERFSTANQGASIEDVMTSIETMVPEAAAAGRATSVIISVAFGCPYEGEVDPEVVVALAARSVASGADEIALGDTIGVAVPADVSRRIAMVRTVTRGANLRMHVHDTRNTGVANVYAALVSGVATIDSSVGGAGGCPFAPNATGNVPTEDVLYMLERSGIETGIDRDTVTETGRWLGTHLGKLMPSAIARAGGFPV